MRYPSQKFRVACRTEANSEKARAVTMEPAADYKLPYKSWFRALLGTAPPTLKATWKAWRQRR